jgi:hypothetical protein
VAGRDLLVVLGLTLVLVGEDGPAVHAEGPGADALELVAEDGGALREVVLHFDPRVESDVGATYRDLLRALEPTVRGWIVVERARDFDLFRQRLGEWEVARPERFRPVVVGKPITTWSRDRYTLARTRSGARVLLVPPRPHDGSEARRNDYQAPFALARAAGATVEPLPLVFDAGDLLPTRRHVIATALLAGRNAGGALGELGRLRRYLRQRAGREVVLLGRDPTDVPPHHVGMFVAPLDDRTLLVGDPEAGLALLDAAAERDLPLPVERRPEALRRFARVARELREAGFTVHSVPLVPMNNGISYVTYTNVLLERRADGRTHAYVPQFGLRVLDAAGRAAYERAGIIVHGVDVRRVYPHGGTLHCLVNVLDRAP